MLNGKLSRRTAIIGVGSIATGTIALQTITGQSQAAQVQLDNLTIQDNSQMVTEPLTDVRISCDATYEYNSNRAPESWELNLYVGTHPDELYTITTREETETFETDSDTVTLSASLLNAPSFDLEMFQPDAGSSRSVSFLVGLEFLIFGANEVQIEDYVEDTATLSVENGTYELTSGVGGVGNVSVQT